MQSQTEVIPRQLFYVMRLFIGLLVFDKAIGKLFLGKINEIQPSISPFLTLYSFKRSPTVIKAQCLFLRLARKNLTRFLVSPSNRLKKDYTIKKQK